MEDSIYADVSTRKTWCDKCEHDTEHQMLMDVSVEHIKIEAPEKDVNLGGANICSATATASQCLSCGKYVNLKESVPKE